MLEQVAGLGLVLVELVELLVAVPDVGHLAVRIGKQRRAAGSAIILVLGQHRQRGLLVRLPGEGWCQELAIVVDLVDLGAAVAPQPGQARLESLIVVDGAAEIELALVTVVVAVLGLHFAKRERQRPFADLVDDPARQSLAIQYGRRPLDDVDPLEAVGLAAEIGEPARCRLPHAVEVISITFGGRGETAQRELVIARVEAEIPGLDAGRIAQCLGDGLHVALDHLVPGDYRDRLRRLE